CRPPQPTTRSCGESWKDPKGRRIRDVGNHGGTAPASPAPAVGGEELMTDDEGDDPAPRVASPVEGTRAMRGAHVFKEIDWRRVLWGIGVGVTITPGAPEPPAGGMVPRAAESLPLVRPSLTAIDAAFAAGPLRHEAGLATWAHTLVRLRLRHGLSEELA